jgi:hypothetical protein
MTRLHEAAIGILCCIRRDNNQATAHTKRKLTTKNIRRLKLEYPHADMDLSLGVSLFLSKKSTLTKKNDCDNSQCSVPLVIMRGIAHR